MPVRDPITAGRLLALHFLAGALSCSTVPFQDRPLGNEYATLTWLRKQTRPLAKHDRDLSRVFRGLNPENPPRRWSSARTAKRELKRLATQAQRLGRPPSSPQGRR